jgi:hypothetical protein
VKKVIFSALVCLLWVFCTASRAEVQYPLIIDKTYSPEVGANNLITLHRGIYALENRFFKTRWFDESTFGKKTLGVTFRLCKTILLDSVLDHFSFLVQHEVFGHGSRYREFGYIKNSYELSLLFPYGCSSGWARDGILSSGRIITPHEDMAMVIGGSEASTILSNTMRYKWLQRGSINYRETFLYLLTANDLSLYILRTKHGLRRPEGNDILSFLSAINAHEGYPNEEDCRLTLDDLTNYALINFLNPFQYFSLYTYFSGYLWSGKENGILPMIKIWNIKYLPSFRLGLTPFGAEFYLENFIVFTKKIINLYFRYGEPTFYKFYGLGLKAIDLVHNHKLSVNARLDMWHQPSILLGGETAEAAKTGMGGALFGTVFYRISRAYSSIHLRVQIGYKTPGFLEGEKLGKGFIGRIGISFLEL